MALLPSTRSPERRALVAGLGVAALLVLIAWRAEHALAGAWGFPLDDTWIHCTIARNLVQGHGWSYNPGVPVQNSSGPLWTALIAIGYLVSGPGVWVPKILGALCFLGCVFMAWRLARTLSGDGWAAAGAALATALSGPLLWHGLSGMETPLAALLVAGTLDTFVAWTTGRRRFAWTIFAALGTAARPEVLVLLPLLAALRWWEARHAAARWREAALAAGIGIVLLLPYFALNLSRSGSMFPSTFAAKAGATGVVNALRHGDVRELLVSLTLAPYVWTVHALAFWGRTNLALLVAAALGCVAAARGPHRTLVPALVLLVLPALRGAAAPHWNPIIQQGRYIGTLLPVFFAVAAVGGAAFVRGTRCRPGRRPLAAVLAVAAVALVVLELRLPHVGAGVFTTLSALLPGVIPDPGLDGYLQWERFGLLVAHAGCRPAGGAWGGAAAGAARGRHRARSRGARAAGDRRQPHPTFLRPQRSQHPRHGRHAREVGARSGAAGHARRGERHRCPGLLRGTAGRGRDGARDAGTGALFVTTAAAHADRHATPAPRDLRPVPQLVPRVDRVPIALDPTAAAHGARQHDPGGFVGRGVPSELGALRPLLQ